MIDDLLRPIGPGPRPPVDGFVSALRAGRRRRWRTLRTNAACAATALAAVVAAMTPRLSSTAVTGLEPTRPVLPSVARATPSQSPSPTPSPAPTAAPPDEDYHPGHGAPDGDGPGGGWQAYDPADGPSRSPGAGDPAPGGAPSPPGERPGDPEPGSGGPGDPQPSGTSDPGSGPGSDPGSPSPGTSEPPPGPQPSPSPSPSPEPEPVDQSVEDQSATQPCETSAWCLSARTVKQSDGAWTLTLRACRPASDTQGVIRFRYENEADFRVMRDGVEVWRWSVGQPDEAYEHDEYVDRWQCAVWSTTWWRVDQGGSRVASGTYRLDAVSTATNLPADWVSTAFTVS